MQGKELTGGDMDRVWVMDSGFFMVVFIEDE